MGCKERHGDGPKEGEKQATIAQTQKGAVGGSDPFDSEIGARAFVRSLLAQLCRVLGGPGLCVGLDICHGERQADE